MKSILDSIIIHFYKLISTLKVIYFNKSYNKAQKPTTKQFIVASTGLQSNCSAKSLLFCVINRPNCFTPIYTRNCRCANETSCYY